MGNHRAPSSAARPALVRFGFPRGVAAVATVVALALGSLAAVSAQGNVTQAGCAALAPGAVGPAVATIQRLVGASPDGDFGPLTQAALRRWQHRHHLPATGVVDAPTWRSFPAAVGRAACARPVHGGGVSGCARLHRGAFGPAVEVLQAAVRAHVDGAFGPHTEAAVRRAQRSHHLHPSGVVGPATWAALHLTATPVCSSGRASPTAHQRAEATIRVEVRRLATALVRRPAHRPGPVVAKVLAFARAQRGKPYRWGGDGPRSYDCSGLVLAAYEHAGITVPRVAADQYAAGPAVRLDRARPGDLLFYADDRTRPRTIHHVVIYAGAGRVIEAPQPGEVVKTVPLWTDGLLPAAVRPAARLRLPLHPGATGWTVTQLQAELDRHGDRLTVDGGYGPHTRSAVRRWKHAHHLPATAIFGRRAWLTLGSRPHR